MITYEQKNNIEFLKYTNEGQYLDRKSAKKKPDEIIKHMVGFANASGGLLVIGIEDDGTITGFNYNGAKPIEEFRNAPIKYLRSTPIVFKDYIVSVINNLGVEDVILVFDISPSKDSVVVCYDEAVYLRVKDETQKLSYEQRQLLEYDRGQRFFEDEIVEGSSIDDVDRTLLSVYKNRMEVVDADDEEILSARNLMRNGKLTNAGVLLFSKYPTKFLPNARIKFLKYDGNISKVGTEFNLIKEITIEGAIPNMIHKIKDVMSSQLREFQYLNSITGTFDIMPEYPEFSWFEGVVNALTHRDYSFRGDYIRVSMFDDRLEIFSPGKLPNIVTIENMLNTRYSRNPRIARVLSEFGWVKELNEGIKRIYSEMQKAFLHEPEFFEPNQNSILLVLKNNILNRHIRVTEKMLAVLDNDVFLSLNDDERQVIQYAYNSDKITVKKCAILLNRSNPYTSSLLKKVSELGFLKWHGNSPKDPTQYYTFAK